VDVPKEGVDKVVVFLKVNLEKKDPEHKSIVVKEEDISGVILD